MDRELVLSLGVSLATGLLVGLERQMAIEARDGKEVLPGGVRTFPLIALAGSLAVLFSTTTPYVFSASVLGLVALLAAFRLGLQPEHREGGFTTDIAAVVTFLLGGFAVSTLVAEASSRLLTTAALGVVVTLLLSIKPRLHAAVRRISVEDIFATLQLLLVAVVILPLLPDEAFGPYSAINPAQIGRMILFVGAVSFVGYVASRLLGKGRGLIVTGFVGGLVSSTAVTFAMSRRAKADPAAAPAAAVAIVAACAMMFGRVLVAAAVVHAPLVSRLAWPMAAMGLVGAVALVQLTRKARDERAAHDGELDLKNPFELKSAVVFGLLFAGVIFISKAAQATLGDAALYVAGAVAGATDVDAITLSAAALARDGLDLGVATATILIASFSNTVVKGGITFFSGGKAFGMRVARVLGAMVLAGGLVLAVVQLVTR